jgi:hypothetical protein
VSFWLGLLYTVLPEGRCFELWDCIAAGLPELMLMAGCLLALLTRLYLVWLLPQADDGYLYPLDRAFFYVHKPPMLIPFDEVWP